MAGTWLYQGAFKGLVLKITFSISFSIIADTINWSQLVKFSDIRYDNNGKLIYKGYNYFCIIQNQMIIQYFQCSNCSKTNRYTRIIRQIFWHLPAIIIIF